LPPAIAFPAPERQPAARDPVSIESGNFLKHVLTGIQQAVTDGQFVGGNIARLDDGSVVIPIRRRDGVPDPAEDQ
jgi:hypothetical protein